MSTSPTSHSIADKPDEDLDWRKSIVDLMKLLKLDSSLKARKELATELKYTGDMNNSAGMNVWLHKQVMAKLAANGGKVPSDLIHCTATSLATPSERRPRGKPLAGRLYPTRVSADVNRVA